MMGKQLRLVKVVVQPVFVIDDGEQIEEVDHPAVAIPAAEWPTYSSERFPAEVEEWQRELDEEAAPKKVQRERAQRKPRKCRSPQS